MDRNSIRRFTCKRCGKPSTDLQGGFTQYSQKHETELIYENVDLCDKCFKQTNAEKKNLGFLQEAIQKGVFKQDDMEVLKRFQTDKYFRRAILENIGVIKTSNPIPLSKWGLSYVG